MHSYLWFSFDFSLAPNVSTTTTANSIVASWDRDKNAVQYSVTLSEPNFMSNISNGTSVTFGSLVPATMYNLTVQGIDSMNRNGDLAIVNVTTDRMGKLARGNTLHYLEMPIL